MSRPLKRSALKLLSFSFLISINISAESKVFIVLEKYLSQIEVVSTLEDRNTGLMHRKSLPDDGGMIFVWDRKKIQCMWMKNTLIPLSVAFLNKDKKIINIEKMEPNQTTTIYKSKDLALYAVEVNQGWFEKNKVSVGDNFKF